MPRTDPRWTICWKGINEIINYLECISNGLTTLYDSYFLQ